jgi:hypothetical protein
MWNRLSPAVLFALASLFVLASLGLGSCSLYHRAYPDTPPAKPSYELLTVQIDDFGSFWDASKAQAALVAVENQSLSMTSSTYVVVFIHGWHNNAAPGNLNLQQFNGWLGQLSAEFSKPERRAARQELTGSAQFKLIGIYVGWRGRALPWLFDYGTMWWRKTAAERVGDGDLAEFLERLQRIYLRANAYSRFSEHPGATPFTGLFTVGHSFGGQALLKAVARPIEEDLAKRAPSMTNAVTPVVTPEHRTEVQVPIDSYGDLNVLVNPATEAYQLSRIDDLYRQLAYPARQTPQLVVFSADNDVPRAFYFPIARGLTSPFRPLFQNSYQGRLWGKALGELTDQQTHELRAAEGNPDSLDDDDFKPGSRRKVADYDFTSTTVFSGSRLTRLPTVAAIENSPIAVIVTHDKIIDGHNGVFDTAFLDFLSKYIAYIEGKRIVLRYEQLNAQKRSEERGATSR